MPITEGRFYNFDTAHLAPLRADITILAEELALDHSWGEEKLYRGVELDELAHRCLARAFKTRAGTDDRDLFSSIWMEVFPNGYARQREALREKIRTSLASSDPDLQEWARERQERFEMPGPEEIGLEAYTQAAVIAQQPPDPRKEMVESTLDRLRRATPSWGQPDGPGGLAR